MKYTLALLTALLSALLLAPLAVLYAAESSLTKLHTPRTDYNCLYNIESLMHCNEDISAAKIKWVVEKLRGTDVDAIMCCPTAWRMNMPLQALGAMLGHPCRRPPHRSAEADVLRSRAACGFRTGSRRTRPSRWSSASVCRAGG